MPASQVARLLAISVTRVYLAKHRVARVVPTEAPTVSAPLHRCILSLTSKFLRGMIAGTANDYRRRPMKTGVSENGRAEIPRPSSSGGEFNRRSFMQRVLAAGAAANLPLVSLAAPTPDSTQGKTGGGVSSSA